MKSGRDLNLLLMELVMPLTSGEKISDIINQGMGPNPMENAKMYRQRLDKGRKLMELATSGWLFWIQKYSPRPYNDIIMIKAEEMSNILRPSLSIRMAARAVATTCTPPEMVFNLEKDPWCRRVYRVSQQVLVKISDLREIRILKFFRSKIFVKLK